MPLMKDLSRAQMSFEVQGHDIDEYLVVRFRGSEGLSRLYRFEIDLVLERGEPTATIVGKPAALSINTPNGERWFHGVVSRFELSGESAGQSYIRVELMPSLWWLTHRYSSRIFQNQTVKDIITRVLTDGGIPSDRFDLSRLTKDYPVREYTVQYRETDLNFISRLMEYEGIFYFFEQSKDKHVLVLAEKNSDCAPIPDDPALPYQPPTGLQTESEHIWRFRTMAAIRPSVVVLNDYNFENPPLNLLAKADNGFLPGLVFSDFPGEYQNQARGTALAKLRAEEFEASLWTYVGMSNCRRLAPGRKFKLTDHPWKDLNGEFLVTAVTHEGKEATHRTTSGTNGRTRSLDARVHQSLLAARNDVNPAIASLAEGLLQIATRLGAGDPTANRALTQWLYHAGQVVRDLPSAALASGANPLEWLSIPNLISDLAPGSTVDFDAPVYECRFECLVSERPFRPSRVTPWPVIGTQTARVVGPPGEEIHVDKYGRVKVQFNWDLQGNEDGNPKLHGADSSCWMRVCQGWAGGQYGIMFIPRVGQEVVVDFLEGNPDQPIVIGRVFNNDLMPPYELPKFKTRSVIKTQSSKGGGGCNEIRFEDLKGKEQLFIQAQRQMDTLVKAGHFHTAGGYHLLVGGEKDGQLYGEYRQKVFKAKHVHVKGEQRTWIEDKESHSVDKDQAIKIGGARSLSVSGDLADAISKNHKHQVTETYHCEANSIKLEGCQIEITAGGNSIVLCDSGIFINGSLVHINSGAGPTVAPVQAGGTADAPEDPGAADSAQPGRDVRYAGPSAAPGVLPPLPEIPGHEFKATFIEIMLVDEAGVPVPGEPFDVTLPNGEVEHGITGADGLSHLELPSDGLCQVSFRRLDASVWEKIS